MNRKESKIANWTCKSVLIAAGLAIGIPNQAIASQSNKTESNVVAQVQRTIKGNVVDENGDPLIGVTIQVVGKQGAGAVTDLDGNFTLQVAGNNTQLTFSYIGYTTTTVTVGSQNFINVKMKVEDTSLKEVVVVGYGVQKKATLTGAVSMVEGDEVLKGRAATNVGTALQGAIPGLTITRSSSRPTDNPSINIRGGVSANGSDPLVLIDGVDAYLWELNTLNPSDIESVSVLKDAAASIYGARAAGGVILVTTKRAKSGKPSITYNGSATMNYRGKKYPASSGSDWARMMLMADYNDTNHPNGASTLWSCGSQGWNEEFYTRIMNNEAFDWNGSTLLRIDPQNANVVDEVYGTTWGTKHNLTLQTGNENIKSITSLGYSDDRSLIKVTYDGQKKYNFRNNTDFTLGKYVKIETGISYDNKYSNTPTYGVGMGLQDMWIFPFYTKSGEYFYDNFGGNNVVAHLKEGGRTKNYDYMLRLSGKLSIDLSFINKALKGLSFYTKGSIRQYHQNKSEQTHKIQMYSWDDTDGPNLDYGGAVGSQAKEERLTETNARALYQLYEFFLNYDRTFNNKHHIGAMFGNTNELRNNRKYSAYRTSSNRVDLGDLNVYDGTTDRIKDSESYKWAYVSLVGRVNYDYEGKYLVEGTWRHDGSSRLVKKNRWQDYFSASAGWRISEEGFMKDIDWLSNLKLRGSWGQAGSVAGIGNYEAYPQIATGTVVMNGQLVNRAWISGITDDSRTWETVTSTNIGVDFGFLENRLSGSFDYFWRKNNGMLINITYPQVYGGTAPSTNSGKYKTHGWELAINWRDKIGADFNYNVGVSISDARTEVTSYEGMNAINWGVNKIIEGKPLNAIYVFKTDGMFQNQAEVDAYYQQMNGNVSGSLMGNVKNGTTNELIPGCVRRVDLNGDNDITKDDLYYYGDNAPHYNFAINLGASYKGFDFSAFFQGVGQQYSVRNGQMGCAFWSGWTNTNSYFMDNTWYAGDDNGYHTANTNAKFPIISRVGNRNNWNYKNYNDINVINNWYMRCKEIQIGYTLPKTLFAKMPVEKLRVWVAGENLFDISNVKDGMDPEMLSNMGTYKGVDVYSSSISFGLDVTF